MLVTLLRCSKIPISVNAVKLVIVVNIGKCKKSVKMLNAENLVNSIKYRKITEAKKYQFLSIFTYFYRSFYQFVPIFTITCTF